MVASLTQPDPALGVDQSSEVELSTGIELPELELPEVALPDGTDLADGTELESTFRRQLEDPALVLSADYVGHDRRRSGLIGRLARNTFGTRRSLLRLEVAALVVVVLSGTIAVLLVAPGGTASAKLSKGATDDHANARSSAKGQTGVAAPVTHTTRVPSAAAAPVAPTPVPTTPATQPAPVAAPALAASTAAAAPADLTPDQMGAEALTLVRYPWQRIPGYSIQFEPIADAPSPGFYGNTTFTWGQTGGASVLYVYPGETVDRLAGIIAFEIGHEVDAAAVEPQGGETAIENTLGIHPASWAPDCDCAEQGFLSGWYASAFSNYWSPGVGNWSQIAPEPTGAVLAAIDPWLNPAITS
jgi:hypothetical protein